MKLNENQKLVPWYWDKKTAYKKMDKLNQTLDRTSLRIQYDEETFSPYLYKISSGEKIFTWRTGTQLDYDHLINDLIDLLQGRIEPEES